MAREAGAGDGPRGGLRLEGQVLRQPVPDRQSDDRHELERPSILRASSGAGGGLSSNVEGRRKGRWAGFDAWDDAMKNHATKPRSRCAIYTRVSTDHGLEQDFNSLDAQREARTAQRERG